MSHILISQDKLGSVILTRLQLFLLICIHSSCPQTFLPCAGILSTSLSSKTLGLATLTSTASEIGYVSLHTYSPVFVVLPLHLSQPLA